MRISWLPSRFRLALLGLLLAVVLLGVVWQNWFRPIMVIHVTLMSDTKEAKEILSKKIPYSSGKHAKSPPSFELELTEWAGDLVKLDIRAELSRGGNSDRIVGVVASSVEIKDSRGGIPVVFAGWKNDGGIDFHPWLFGTQTSRLPGEENAAYVYGNKSSKGVIWSVFQVPKDATLQLTFKPVPSEQLGEEQLAVLPALARRLPNSNPQTTAEQQRPPDVFIYLIDALRADHLGCYGYSRPTSPVIDEFAAQAALFEDAHTAATWTRPSTATVLTGLYPSVHQAVYFTKNKDEAIEKLGEWVWLMPEMLKEKGYATNAVVTNVNVGEIWGFGQGVDEFACEHMESSAWVNEKASAFLLRQRREQPVFMYLHTLEPHSPYTPQKETFKRFDRGFDGACDGSVDALQKAVSAFGARTKLTPDDIGYLIDLYDAEINDNDRDFAEFLELLKRTGRYENSLIILLSDHGEAFADHGTLEHARTLYKEEMHVPLIIKFPGGRFAGRRVKQRVSLIDIFPTVKAQVGIDKEPQYRLPGIDLTEAAAVPEARIERDIFAELSFYKSNERDMVGIIDRQGYKRTLNLSKRFRGGRDRNFMGLWDTKEDPLEENNLAEEHPVLAAYQEQAIAHWLLAQCYWTEGISKEKGAAVEMTEEMRQQLRALGYLD